jgi:hypothetical protein
MGRRDGDAGAAVSLFSGGRMPRTRAEWIMFGSSLGTIAVLVAIAFLADSSVSPFSKRSAEPAGRRAEAAAVSRNGFPIDTRATEGVRPGEVGARLGETVEVSGLAITVKSFGVQKIPNTTGGSYSEQCAEISASYTAPENPATTADSVGHVPATWVLTTPDGADVPEDVMATPSGESHPTRLVNDDKTTDGYLCFRAPAQPGAYALRANLYPDRPTAWVLDRPDPR